MLIDCDTCIARGNGCHDCVVTVILNQTGAPVEFDDTEQRAVASLVAVGLVPPLRLVSDSSGLIREIA